jgi:hypothetical protein
MDGHKDRHPVVVVAVPASGEVEGAAADEDGAGGHQLVEHLAMSSTIFAIGGCSFDRVGVG